MIKTKTDAKIKNKLFDIKSSKFSFEHYLKDLLAPLVIFSRMLKSVRTP